MSSVAVIIYSYKGKMIKDVVANVMQNSSGNNTVNIHLAEQHPLIKDEYFADKDYVNYNHIFWDHPYGSCIKKFDLIQKAKADYILILGDNILLNKDWDVQLINFVGDSDKIVSGMGRLKISQTKLFYLDKEYENNNDFTLSHFVDKDLIFATSNTFKNTDYPTFLKYRGEEEYLSLFWYTSGRDIYSSPSSIGSEIGVNALETLYVPYSINHNYNEVIEVLKGGTSKKIKLQTQRSVQDFIAFHSIDISKIHPLPFQTNDVEYDCYKTEFDDLDGRKFLGRTNAIY